MPIDFRTYTDPGVYIEAITPPVVFTAAIEPTILAIVASAPSARTVTESTVLTGSTPSTLNTLGIDPKTVNTSDRLLGTQFVSGAIGSLDSAVTSAATAWTVSTFPDVILPATPFTAIVETEQVTVTVATTGTAQAWTVTRGVNATVAAAHGADQIINDAEQYSTTASLEVTQLAAPISATSTSFNATEAGGVQVVTLVGFAGVDSFTLTYGAETTIPFVRGTNATAAAIKGGLEALTAITTVDVSGTTDAGPFTVSFRNPNVGITALSVTNGVGCTGTVANRGVVSGSYLDMDGERMHVTGVSGSAPQTLTVVRGVRGTTAKSHGATLAYENTGADYTLSRGSGVDAVYNTQDDTTSLTRLDTLRISSGTQVNVQFNATDASQFAPALFNDLSTVRDKYGDPLDANGNIHSELTLAAQLAFANGATQLILVAANPSDTNPIQKAIDKLAFEQSVNVLAVCSGVAADLTYAQGHVQQMADQGLLRRVFLGLNGTVTPVPTSADFVSKAQAFNDERVSMCAPSQYLLDNSTATPLIVPGYFGAVAVAGLHAGLDPQEPLTRKQVFGFLGVNDQDTQTNIFTMQSKGVLVVFQDRFNRLIIKHGLTTNMSTTYTREISVVAARDRLRDFILETLDGGQLLGSAMTSETPNLVMAAVNSALEEATIQNLIADYSDVLYRIPANNQTLIEVQFSYKPTLPLNYIHVLFSIDTSAATVEFQSINQGA